MGCAITKFVIIPPQTVVSWHKLRVGWVKCSIGTSFSITENKVSLVCVLEMMLVTFRAKIHLVMTLTDVLLDETISLYLAIHWVRELGFKGVIFDLDTKLVVEAFISKNNAISEFECLIKVCNSLFFLLL